MNTEDAENNTEPAGIDFLDFLFTVSMSIGLTPEVLGREYITGLLSESWVREGRSPSGSDAFNLGVFLLGFLTLTLSWFGYHGSIKKRPLKYDTLSGMVRFIFDVLLVIIYGLILLRFRDFGIVLGLVVAAHLIFVIWDCFKIIEHWETYRDVPGPFYLQRFRREYVSGLYFILFFLLWVFSRYWPSWLSLILAITFTVLYRVNKNYPMWERLLGVRT